MKHQAPSPAPNKTRDAAPSFAVALVLVALIALPELAMAQDFQEKTCDFLDQITGLLNVASIAVVTIGIIFAGYQIAFAHKRISDVAGILIGALLIGAAGQLANWIIGSRDGSAQCGDIAMIVEQGFRFLG